jgi:hypothetical protein
MTFRILHHNNCFDGACSAAVFSRLHRECIGGASGYEYRGLSHSAVGRVSEDVFGAGENAIVDFKYSPSPRLTWWFDHHESAFTSEQDRKQFEAGQGGALGQRQFFDPDFISCTGLIAKVGRERFGFDTSGLTDLLHWADLIDGARYESAESAVEMKAPAMQLTMVIENAEGAEFIPRVIPLLTRMPLAEIVAQPFVAEKIGPLWDKHRAAMQLVQERAQLKDGVIFFDLTDRSIEGLSKFIPYYFFPEATYTVALTRSSFRVKISVGTNPWTQVPVEHLVNLAAICERFGGGGHARVGAISFDPEAVEQARGVAAEIVAELRRV